MSDLISIDLLFPNDQPPPLSMQAECDRALNELKHNCAFQPLHANKAPYALTLSIQENRFVFRIVDGNGDILPILALSLSPYKRLIRDYKMIIDSYAAMRQQSVMASKLESIDMARRGIHNEAAEKIVERLVDKITIDHDTGRCLFTLLFVLSASTTRHQVL